MAVDLPQEYLDHLKQNVSRLERLGDKFSGIDERVDYVVKQLAQLGISEETIASLVGAVDRLEEMGLAMPQVTEQVTFAQKLEPLQGLKLEEFVPIDGKIISVLFNFPDGCYDPVTGNYLVSMAVGHGTKQICPSEDMLGLNDATPVFPVNQVVKANDVLWAIMENADGLNPHGVSIIVTIVG